jgi:hypothetical protein
MRLGAVYGGYWIRCGVGGGVEADELSVVVYLLVSAIWFCFGFILGGVSGYSSGTRKGVKE